MKIEYNNIYLHFVFTTFNRTKIILEKHRARIGSSLALLFQCPKETLIKFANTL